MRAVQAARLASLTTTPSTCSLPDSGTNRPAIKSTSVVFPDPFAPTRPTAERAGMYRQSFQQKMRELGINVAELGLKSDDE